MINKRRVHSDPMSALRGVSKILCMLIRGGGGVKKPQKYAYVICESPLTFFCLLPTLISKGQRT